MRSNNAGTMARLRRSGAEIRSVPVARAGSKRSVVAEAQLDLFDGFAQGLADRFGAGREDETTFGAADQKIVAEQGSQPAQRIADGRLRAVQNLGRAGDIALGDQRVEDPQQVEIELVEVHASFTR